MYKLALTFCVLMLLILAAPALGHIPPKAAAQVCLAVGIVGAIWLTTRRDGEMGFYFFVISLIPAGAFGLIAATIPA